MKFELNPKDLFEILTKWCEQEHGASLHALQWQVEDDKEFQGVIILAGPE